MVRSRITKKHKHTNFISYTNKKRCLKNYNIAEANVNKAIEKLGKLEDLEEQLGCPLEVMFKALEEGIIINNTLEKLPSLLKLNSINKWCFEMRAEIYFLSDYQKTWWLKGEKPND